MSKVYLAIAGLTAFSMGAFILLAPVFFYASYGIDVAGQVNLLSELRAHSLLLVGIGAFAVAAVFVQRLEGLALVVSTSVYLSYALSRLIGVAFDGWPSAGFLIAGAVEMALGLTGLALLLRRRPLGAAQPA